MPTPDDHGYEYAHGAPSREILDRWLTAHRISHDGRLEVTEMRDGLGWRVVAADDIDMGEKLCAIPKTSVLSHRTSSLPPLPAYDESAGPSPNGSMNSRTTLHLTLCLLHELRLGEQSSFYGYLQSLPRDTVLLPVLWQVEEIAGADGVKASKWLKGTQAKRELSFREREGLGLSDLEAFYKITSTHLPPTATHPTPSPLHAFLHAFSLISTRAFLIDLYHLIALCPFADILNHSSAPHTSLLADDYTCHICGSLAACTHDIYPPGVNGPHAANRSGAGVGAGAGAAAVPYRLSHLGQRERDRISREEDTVEMRAERPIAKGEEVWNSYGEGISDSKLCVEWGFVAEDFVGEGLTWDIEEIVGAGDGPAGGLAGDKSVQGRLNHKSAAGPGVTDTEADLEPAKGGPSPSDLPNVTPEVSESSRIYDPLWAIIDTLSPFGQRPDDEDTDTLLCQPIGRLLNLDQSARVSTSLFALLWLDGVSDSDSDDCADGGGSTVHGGMDTERLREGLAEAIRSVEEVWAGISGEDQDESEDDNGDESEEGNGERDDDDEEHDGDQGVCNTPVRVDKYTRIGSSEDTPPPPPQTITLDGGHRTLRACRRVRSLLRARVGGMYGPDLSVEELFEMRDKLHLQGEPLQHMALTLLINERVLLRSAGDKWDRLLAAVS